MYCAVHAVADFQLELTANKLTTCKAHTHLGTGSEKQNNRQKRNWISTHKRVQRPLEGKREEEREGGGRERERERERE